MSTTLSRCIRLSALVLACFSHLRGVQELKWLRLLLSSLVPRKQEAETRRHSPPWSPVPSYEKLFCWKEVQPRWVCVRAGRGPGHVSTFPAAPPSSLLLGLSLCSSADGYRLGPGNHFTAALLEISVLSPLSEQSGFISVTPWPSLSSSQCSFLCWYVYKGK